MFKKLHFIVTRLKKKFQSKTLNNVLRITIKIFVYQLPLVHLLKPVFQMRDALFQFKHAKHKLKSMYFFLKTSFKKIFKVYWYVKLTIYQFWTFGTA